MTRRTKWLAYSDLAWTEHIIAPPDEYTEETELLVNTIRQHSKIELKTLLHLGCGAGGNDYTFKPAFPISNRDLGILLW